MAVGLQDIIKQSASPMQKGFISDLLRYSDLLASIPFDTVDGLQVTAQRWQTLSAAGFRKLNGGYTEGTGTVEDVAETLALLGGDIKIDKVGDKVAPLVEKPLVTQMKMKAKAVAFAFNDAFINGDQGSNPDTFEGLKKRVAGEPSRMTINIQGSTDSLKIFANTANELALLDALHQAVKYVDGATHIFMNENTYIKFGTLLRTLGLAYDTVNMFDRKYPSFAGIPLVDVGLKGDKSTEIIFNTEDPGDAGNDATSIYVARMDSDDGLRGIQLKGMDMQVYDPLNGNESESGPQYLRRIDWAVGLMNISQYAVCRISNIRMAAS
jgi:hypothetical protein